MARRVLLASVVVFLIWEALDFLIHNVILAGAYEATAGMWRPEGEMKMGVLFVAVFIAALSFTAVYGWLVGRKSPTTGLKYGLLWGIGAGVAMGYGSYAVMPIPYLVAFTWFAGAVVEGAAGGLAAGLLVRD